MTVSPAPASAPASTKAVYARVWRWHFYAGIYVAPFLIVLALTGLVMLCAGPIDDRLYADRLFVPAPGPATVSLDAQIAAVAARFPDRTVTQVRPGFDPSRSTQILTTEGDDVVAVYVDPTSGLVLGEIADARRPTMLARRLHGTLFAGQVGDWLIEIAAGLGVVLIVSGLYLWWPRQTGWGRAFAIRRRPRRVCVRDAHKLVGLLAAPALLVYLLTGLAWTDVWGGRFTQAWSTLPGTPASADQIDEGPTHGRILNRPGRLEAPWGLEQTPMPLSVVARQHGGHEGHADHGMAASPAITADQAVAAARVQGIRDRFVVRPPAGPRGVWTVSATGMTGVIADPRDEITVHVDQYTGDIRGVVTWNDYSLPARGMAFGVPLHQGSFGTWNLMVAGSICVAILGLSVTGVLAWWWRRPSGARRLVAPPLPAGAGAPRVAIVTAVVVGLLFPLVGLTFVVVGLVDAFVLRRIPALRAAFD